MRINDWSSDVCSSDLHVRQAVQFALQYCVSTQLHVELQQSDVGHDASQVNGRFHAGVTTANHRDALAFEQRAVAVRAVCHALVAVLLLARHVHFAPARSEEHTSELQSLMRISYAVFC